ncbi:ABC transporter permease [Haliangium sp.]|uniref:ABC transporter permease n=1 Tax=Haliangium sp. TaxID=2663208 RepID=UPI003D140320
MSEPGRGVGRALVPPLVVLVSGLALWELAVWIAQPPKFLFCAPSDVWTALVEDAAALVRATLMTTISVLVGFGLAAGLGIAGAVLLASNRVLERAFYPFTVFLQTVPLVAIAPMLVLWLDPGIPAVSVCAFIVCLFPVITNTLIGIRSIPRPQVELFLLYGASRRQALFKLELPGALPNIMTGLRIAAGLAVIGAVVGEFVAGQLGAQRGLGIVVVVSARQGALPLLFAAVGLASALGLAMLGLVNAASYALLHKWHVSHRTSR